MKNMLGAVILYFFSSPTVLLITFTLSVFLACLFAIISYARRY